MGKTVEMETELNVSVLAENGIKLNALIDIDDELYHSMPGYSSTFIKNMFNKCPEYARYKLEEDTSPPTEALIVGRALHTFLLQPHKFNDEFRIAPVSDKRLVAYKTWLKDSDPNKTPLRASFRELGKGVLTQLMTGINVFDNIISHPEALIEQSVFTIHKRTGLLVKMKADILLNTMGFDLKSTTDADPYAFATSIGKYSYDIQAAFYILVCQSAGVEMKGFSFISVEKEPPYLWSSTVLKAEDILQAHRVVELQLQEIAQSIERGKWRGYMRDDELSVVVHAKYWRKVQIENYLIENEASRMVNV